VNSKRIVLFIFVFNLNLFERAQAQAVSDCFGCDPLAEVSITNKGLARLIETSLKENFITLNNEIKNRANFRDLTLDHSMCKSQTVAEAWAARKNKADVSTASSNCIGMPDLTDENELSQQTKLRPFNAVLSKFRLKQLEIGVEPITCVNFVCNITAKLKKMEVEGELRVNYADRAEVFIPRTNIKLNASDKVDVTLSAQAFVDPFTGRLEDLAFLSKDKMQLNVKPGSFNFDLAFKKGFDSKEKEVSLMGKYLAKQMQVVKSKKNPNEFYRAQVDKYVHDKVFREWALAKDKSETIEQIEKRVEAKLFASYGSKEKLIEKLKQTEWPDFSDNKKVYEFAISPPPELAFVPEILERTRSAETAALAENAGFTSKQGYELALMGNYAANVLQDTPVFVDEVLQPFLKKEIIPLVEEEVNNELRNLKNYWKNISQVPSLNTQNFLELEQLDLSLKTASAAQKPALLAAKKKLEQQMKDDWVPIDTAVFLDQNIEGQKVLRAQIGSSDPRCNSVARKFSTDNDDDFDIRTELGMNTLQEYFNKMAENKKLDLCVGGDSSKECKGGTSVKIRKPPKISCENGQFRFDLDAEAKRYIFGADISGQITAKVKQCNNDPCFELTEPNGRIKNIFMNFFFGESVRHSIEVAAKATTNQAIPIPNVGLRKLQTNPQNCSTKLDWDIKP
jgi:hypothetical protein